MEIKTKFALGDKVWTIHNFKATQIEIAAIEINANGVSVRAKDEYAAFSENNCFTTKEALVKHLMRD